MLGNLKNFQIYLERKFTNASDKYAFGVTLWEIFSNAQTPFAELSYDVIFFFIFAD